VRGRATVCHCFEFEEYQRSLYPCVLSSSLKFPGQTFINWGSGPSFVFTNFIHNDNDNSDVILSLQKCTAHSSVNAGFIDPDLGNLTLQT